MKKISLKQILLLAAGVLGVVALIMMFVSAISVETKTVLGNGTTIYSGIEVLFGKKNDSGDVILEGAGGAFVGYLLALVAGDAAVVSALVIKDKKIAKFVAIGAAVLFVVAAILMFCEKAMWCSVNEIESSGSLVIGGITLGEGTVSLAAGPIVGGILAIVGAGAAGVSVVMKD